MIHILLAVLDLGGTFVFAISGAAAAVKHRLDIFGVMVLAFAAGNAGGITRDVLIGAVPPAAIANWSYVGVSILAGFCVLLVSGDRAPDQSGAVVRCRGPGIFRGRRRAKGAGPWNESGDGCTSWHVDRYRGWHAA